MIENLHFVRPLMFLGFIPLSLFLIILYRHKSSLVNWKSVCDAKLLPYILSQGINKSNRWPLLLVALAASLSIIASAGPAFEKLAKPVYREQSSLIILLDLSQSMDATDLKPSRVERAKHKLLDLLNKRKAGQTALIVYAADAFTVTPLTDDSNTIANLVPSLETALMPSQGSHAYIAIDKSLQLLQQANAASGDVLLIGDDITERDLKSIKQLAAKGYRLSVLGVGTKDGSPVSLNGGFLQDKTGAIIIPKLKPRKLQQAALQGSGLYASIQADDADIDKLSRLFSSRKIKDKHDETSTGMKLTADIWQEEGPWLLLFVIPLVAVWARKGWLLCFTALMLPIPDSAYALELNNLWRNPNQNAMRLFEAGANKKAAEKFQRDDWKAASHYRSGDYQKSLEALQTVNSSDDYYNKGNALAKLGRYDEAVDAYDESLKLDANNEDAKANREKVKNAIEQQPKSDDGENKKDKDSQDSQQGDKEDQQKDQQENNQDSDADKSEQADSKDQKDSNENPADSEQQSEQQQQDKKNQAEQAIKDAQESEAKNSDENKDDAEIKNNSVEEIKLSEDDHAVEQWLKRVPDNPEELLRRKFLYQYKHMQNKTPSQKPW